jgi:alkanesulfonate monooxygenase
MTLDIYWQLDVAAEPDRSEPRARAAAGTIARDVRTLMQNRFDYYAQIARAAEQTAFDGLFLPYREDADDSRIVAATMARSVPRLRLVPQFPPSVGSAVYAAKQAASFQRATRGRLGWAILPDAGIEARASDGDDVPEEEFGARLAEFLTVARGVHQERPFSFKGRHFEVQGGGFEAPLDRDPFPAVFLQGDEEEAMAFSARHADVHLLRAALFATLRSQIEAIDGLAVVAGRHVDFGLVQPLVVRETEEEARRDAERAGIAPHAIVGDYDAAARELGRRVALGVDHLVLAASPSLEEAYRVGQHVVPRLRAIVGEVRAAA